MTTTTAPFTPTPLCEPWCVEHEVFPSDDPQDPEPRITHWSAEVELGVCLVRHENYADNDGAIAVTIHGRDLDLDGISLADARRVAAAMLQLVAKAEVR